MKTDAKAILYDQSNGKIKLIEKDEVCELLKPFRLKESMTYKEIAEKCKFNKVSNGIYNLKNNNSTKLIFLIDKTLDEFKDFLKKNNLPVYEENSIILYHGSSGGIKTNIDVKYKTDSVNDFGIGFYLGDVEEQARSRIQNVKEPYLYTFKLNITPEIKVYNFIDDILWALYIAYNRNKFDFSNYPKLITKFKEIDNYELIIGNIADDKIGDAYTYFIGGSDSDLYLKDCLKLIKFGKQYVIKNNKYTQPPYLVKLKEQFLTKQDKLDAIAWTQKMKKDMDKNLNDIREKYRHKGKYFDEILKEWK